MVRAAWEGLGNKTLKDISPNSKDAQSLRDAATQLEKDRGRREWAEKGVTTVLYKHGLENLSLKWFSIMCKTSLCNCLPSRKDC